MIIGVPKELKQAEYRVGLTDNNVHHLIKNGHRVLVQTQAGKGILITDEDYIQAGAEIISTIEDLYQQAEMIIKVKEPLPEEYDLLQENQILYTFLHLAPDINLTKALLRKKVKAIAYETIQKEDGSLPLLTPMSEVAGRLATQVGATCLQKNHGGKGILLGGVPGVQQGHTVIIGGGNVGLNAALIALGLGSKVTILDTNPRRLEYIDQLYYGRIQTLHSTPKNLTETVQTADLLIGAVLLTGRKAPKLVNKGMVASMSEGSVIVDVSIDQGGCIETSHLTSHEDPIFIYEGVLHYAVPNMPSMAAQTATYALTTVTLPYALQIANKGLEKSLRGDPVLAGGLNVYQGKITHPALARDLKMEYHPFY